MSKHLLIGIPCVVLLVGSIIALLYACGEWAGYRQDIGIAQAIAPPPLDRLVNMVRSNPDAEKARTLAAAEIESDARTQMVMHQALLRIARHAEAGFRVMCFTFAGAFMLLCLLTVGLYPSFRK